MSQYTKHPDYKSLPDAYKDIWTPEEHAWMTDEQRKNIDDVCYPDEEGE